MRNKCFKYNIEKNRRPWRFLLNRRKIVRIIIFLQILCISFSLIAQDEVKGGKEGMAQSDFYKLTDKFVENKIYFNFPKGTYPVQQVEQYDVYYDLAYRVGDEKIEYRVAYKSSESYIQENQDYIESVNLMLIVMSANISQQAEKLPQIMEINSEAVQEIFNADYGIFAIVDGDSMFSSGYKHVLITAIHKIGKGTLYSFILSDDYKSLKAITPDIYKYFSSFYFFKYEDRPF